MRDRPSWGPFGDRTACARLDSRHVAGLTTPHLDKLTRGNAWSHVLGVKGSLVSAGG